MTDTIDLGKLLHAKGDRYAKQLGSFSLSDSIEVGSDAVSVWNLLRSQNGRTFRVLVQCQNGVVRDWIGRGGVYDSRQDGTVQGTGAPMANEDRLNLSFWTATYGDKVNTGTGKGYRTLKAEFVIAIHASGKQYFTAFGMELYQASNF